MSEKWYSSNNGGQSNDTTQIYKLLSEIPADTLLDVMADQWEDMDETNFDVQSIDVYLAALDENCPMALDYNAEASLAAFREKHAYMFNDNEPLNHSYSIPRHRPHFYRRAVRLISVTIIVIFGCMITVQAIGFDVFGKVARWTEEVFRLDLPAQTENGQINIDQAGINAEYNNLQEALGAYGITQPVVPSWYPEGFKSVLVAVSSLPGYIKFAEVYESDDNSLSLTIKQFVTEEAAGGAFEKDGNDVTAYEKDGVDHYLMSNNDQQRAVWNSGNIIVSISGNLSQEDLIRMIDSIYEKEG